MVLCNGIFKIKLRSEKIEALVSMPPCPKDVWCAALDAVSTCTRFILIIHMVIAALMTDFYSWNQIVNADK